MNTAWEIIRDDIRMSAKTNLGFYKLKEHNPCKMPSSGMQRRVVLVRTDISERIASVIRLKGIGDRNISSN
jgi:hypothetical protein